MVTIDMGKLSKKPTSTKAELVGQSKISSFFKNGPAVKSVGSSSLFQEVGSKRAPTLNRKQPFSVRGNDVTPITNGEPHTEILIPETQLVELSDSENSPPKAQLLKPTGVHDEVADDHVTSDDESIIPGTPDVPRFKVNRRSFLSSTATLCQQPNLKPKPLKADVKKIKKFKQLRKRLSSGGVSVKFSSGSSNGFESITNEIDSFDNGPLIDVEITPSRKRPASSGISPSPKRTSTNTTTTTSPLDFKKTTDEITRVDKCPTAALKKPKPNANPEAVRKLNLYQCGLKDKVSLIEDKTITCADDDVLSDILGELHTQLDKIPPTNARNKISPVLKNKTVISDCNRKLKAALKGDNHYQSHAAKPKNLSRISLTSPLSTSDESLTTRGNNSSHSVLTSDPIVEKITLDSTIQGNLYCKSDNTTIQNGSAGDSEGISERGIPSDDASTSKNSTKNKSRQVCRTEVDALFDDSFEKAVSHDGIPEDDSFMEFAANLESESQELCQEFHSLSPFKAQKAAKGKEASPSSSPFADQFGRHKVTSVEFDRSKQELLLRLQSTSCQKCRTCRLQGFWCDIKVAVGDIVHLVDVTFDLNDACTVSDNHGLIIVHPDRLISGTSVVSAVHCLRRSILNEMFKGCDGSNIYMLYGSIIHTFFQEALQKSIYVKEDLLKLAREVLKQNKFIHDMYNQNVTEDAVMAEVIKYILPFQAWIQKFTNIVKFALGSQRPESGITVTNIQDIEENIWSPRFGIKGKIDLTVKAKIWGKSTKPETKVVPLELKTGKATYSVEHKGQVTLYSMMSSDRRDDPNLGLLVYLKEGDMQAIPVNSANKAGLIQLRNNMAAYLQNRLQSTIGEDGKETCVIGQLPEPINSQRSCEKCPHLLNCSIYSREIEKRTFSSRHAMSELLPGALSHLQQSHLDYFTRWCLMLELESAQGKSGKNIREIWTIPAAERERTGGCLSGMVLADSQPVESNQFILTFKRQRVSSSSTSNFMDNLGLSLNDTIVVSGENKALIALCMGTITELTREHVKITTDRDLQESKTRGTIFRLDKCDIFNTMGLYFTNLSRLMADDPISSNLRRLLLDKDKPLFLPTLSKTAIEKVRGIFKTLNKPQKTAILKVLMCKDYILVKGFPGTGKTSTIVALVKILKLLGHSVLLASYTHSAVDNILLKLKQDDIHFLRLGRLARIHPQLHQFAAENLVKNIKSVTQLRDFYSSQDIVATTCLGSNHVIFSQRKFDICIVDEASQVLQPACLGPLFAAERFVLVGDHKQLPPVVQSREARELGMSESLFSHLDTSGVTFELNLQYRMNSVIMELSNILIYNGALKCGSQSVATSCLPETNQDDLKLYEKTPWLMTCLSRSLDEAAVFLDTSQVPAPESKDCQGQVKNEVEADVVSVIVQAFLQAGVDAEDIGVIAPYRNQVKVIKTRLCDGNHGDIEVNTVDQYQGRDKSVIVISFVKSSYKERSGSGELLNDVRRLNVAVTRAKHKLILLGDVTTLRQYDPVEKIISVLKQRNQIYSLPANAKKEGVL